MSKATAGPWFVYRDSAENFYVGSDIVDVARIVGSDADAHLIAAAPELLEALRNVVNEHGTRYPLGTDDRLMPSHRQSPAIRNAMEEIAKATGEQP